MEKGPNPELLSLKFLRRIRKTDSIESAERKRYISNMNISNFFVRLWHHMYGGEFVANKRLKVEDHFEGRQRVFSPDIIRKTLSGIVLEEIKASSRRGTMFHCSLNQVENYADFLLRRVDRGDEIPEVNYVFIKYGNSRGNDRSLDLTLPGLSKKMSGIRKEAIVIPLNLLFFISLFSKHETRKQDSSDSTWNSQDYFYPSGTLLTFLSKEENAIRSLLEIYNSPDYVLRYGRGRGGEIKVHHHMNFFGDEGKLEELDPLRELFLGDLELEKFMSEPVKAIYRGREYDIKPFPITRYSLSKGHSVAWPSHFFENHKRILGGVGFEDIFEKYRSIYNATLEEDGIPF